MGFCIRTDNHLAFLSLATSLGCIRDCGGKGYQKVPESIIVAQQLGHLGGPLARLSLVRLYIPVEAAQLHNGQLEPESMGKHSTRVCQSGRQQEWILELQYQIMQATTRVYKPPFQSFCIIRL